MEHFIEPDEEDSPQKPGDRVLPLTLGLAFGTLILVTLWFAS